MLKGLKCDTPVKMQRHKVQFSLLQALRLLRANTGAEHLHLLLKSTYAQKKKELPGMSFIMVHLNQKCAATRQPLRKHKVAGTCIGEIWIRQALEELLMLLCSPFVAAQTAAAQRENLP